MDEGNIFLQGLSANDLIDRIRYLIRDELSNHESQDFQEFIGTDEVCEILGISKGTLWHYVKKGAITKYGLGRKVYYKKEEIYNSIKKIG